MMEGPGEVSVSSVLQLHYWSWCSQSVTTNTNHHGCLPASTEATATVSLATQTYQTLTRNLSHCLISTCFSFSFFYVESFFIDLRFFIVARKFVNICLVNVIIVISKLLVVDKTNLTGIILQSLGNLNFLHVST